MELKQNIHVRGIWRAWLHLREPQHLPDPLRVALQPAKGQHCSALVPNVYLDVDHRPDDIALHDLLRWP